MNRRVFIASIAGGLLAAPLAAEAQQAGKLPRVGFLLGLSPGPSREVGAFQRGLRELGYIEGQNIAIDYRYAGGQVERLPELAAELVRLNPDVIVAPYTPPALAAKHATSMIPIVFAGVADAVGAGLIANLGRPGGNITGLTSIAAELGGKRLELLKQVIFKASRVAVLYNPADQSNVLVLKQLQESAPKLGLTLQPFAIREPGDFEGAFSAMARERTHAMFGVPGVLTEREEVNSMDTFKVTLCPAGCGQCPDVEVVGDEVRIGETGNLAVLKKDEWNLLVELIHSGQLAKI